MPRGSLGGGEDRSHIDCPQAIGLLDGHVV
jgi:hypothetical protein